MFAKSNIVITHTPTSFEGVGVRVYSFGGSFSNRIIFLNLFDHE